LPVLARERGEIDHVPFLLLLLLICVFDRRRGLGLGLSLQQRTRQAKRRTVYSFSTEEKKRRAEEMKLERQSGR
jgi:hypothetical protein